MYTMKADKLHKEQYVFLQMNFRHNSAIDHNTNLQDLLIFLMCATAKFYSTIRRHILFTSSNWSNSAYFPLIPLLRQETAP